MIERLKKFLRILKDIGEIPFKGKLDRNAAGFLNEAGVKEGYRVLDFGCGSGTYTIPAAKLVKPNGTVYALDVNKKELDRIESKADREGLENIKRINSSGGTQIPLEEASLDFILLIDVLHELERKENLFEEAFRVLKDGGVISVYPMHLGKGEVEKLALGSGFGQGPTKYDGRVLLFRKEE